MCILGLNFHPTVGFSLNAFVKGMFSHITEKQPVFSSLQTVKVSHELQWCIRSPTLSLRKPAWAHIKDNASFYIQDWVTISYPARQACQARNESLVSVSSPTVYRCVIVRYPVITGQRAIFMIWAFTMHLWKSSTCRRFAAFKTFTLKKKKPRSQIW